MRFEFHILLVEDSPADALLIERALREHAPSHRLTVCAEGSSALEQLRRLHDPNCPAELEPDLVLLDLNLPGIDGAQVLREIKIDPVLCTIPVVVLTTSRRDEDVEQSYLSGANTYIQKPPEYPGYRALADILMTYWCETALRRPRPRPRV